MLIELSDCLVLVLILGFAIPTAMNLPKAVNWENEGVLTPVKNQGRDASCAMHASIASINGKLDHNSKSEERFDGHVRPSNQSITSVSCALFC
jgi:C1A family cysteine protease